MALIPAFPDATVVPIVLRQGATYQRDYTWFPNGAAADLTGMTIRAKVRPDFASAPTMTFECSLVDAANGKFRIRATPTLIATIPVPANTPSTARMFSGGGYDIEIEDSAGTILRIIEGDVSVSREATV